MFHIAAPVSEFYLIRGFSPYQEKLCMSKKCLKEHSPGRKKVPETLTPMFLSAPRQTNTPSKRHVHQNRKIPQRLWDIALAWDTANTSSIPGTTYIWSQIPNRNNP